MTVAQDGDEKHSGHEVDLVIADADMTPITGHQLLEKIFSEPNCRHIPVVCMSILPLLLYLSITVEANY
jgi:CheY-like chemotaxis protein